jgi:hypothetical protein
MTQAQTKEICYERIQRAPETVSALELQELLKSPVLCAALRQILVDSDARGSILLGINLASPQGIAEAQVVQGIARGLSQAVEVFLDLAFPTTEAKETPDATN